MVRCFIRRAFYRLAAQAAWRRLHGLSGERLGANAETAALRAFHRAARRVPAYGRLLARNGIDASKVQDIEAFRRLVPLTDKASVFSENEIASLCVDGKADDAACIYTSSGYSGTFSFGLETQADIDRGRRTLDLLLQMYFHAASKPTLLVSGMPMGLQIPASLPMKLDAGVRTDTILAVIRKLKPVCRQVIVAGEHPFLKKVLEDGVDAGMNWPEHRVSLLTGAEVVPESFRSYAGNILGQDPATPETGKIMITTGISEVGLVIGHETDGCRRLRMAAAGNQALWTALFGQTPFLPTCMQYFPGDFYMETPDVNGQSTLVVTTLSPRRKLPLIRYCTGDWAKVLTHREVCQALEACGREDLRPPLELPMLLLWGRGEHLTVAGRRIYPEQIKEAIYSDPAVASATTANFRMTGDADQLSIFFQLKPNATSSDVRRKAFRTALLTTSGLCMEPHLVPFAEFPGAMDLYYQRKFQYL